MKINIALVGFGLSGRYLQAPFFEAHPDFCLHTIVTSQAEVRTLFPKARQVAQLEEVLSDGSIDLVSIASPNETHAAFARACLLAGKHVLVEKPFAATSEEAIALVALARQQGKHLFVFQNRRFDSDFMTLQSLLKNGDLGDLLRYEAHYNRFKPTLNPKKWKETPNATSGILYDLGAHLVDQCIALFGPPKAVWGEAYAQRPGSDVDDAFDLWLDYGITKAHLSASLMVREPTPRYMLRGTAGTFVKYGIDPQEDHLKAGMSTLAPGFGVESTEWEGNLFYEKEGTPDVRKIPTMPGRWMLLFDNMADVLLRDATPRIPLGDIVAQLQVLEQVK